FQADDDRLRHRTISGEAEQRIGGWRGDHESRIALVQARLSIDFPNASSHCRFRHAPFVVFIEAAPYRRSISSDRRPTMRFLSTILVEENTGKQPSEQMMTEMGKFITEMRSAGKLLDTGGLAPTASGKRVRLRGGKISTVDGPFAEAKEVIGGYAMLEAQSLDEAVALTQRFVELHVADGWELECEVRQVYEADGC
ncbi:MAG: YciI family protein, partial [Rhodanobacteraceae bacterium]